MLIRRIELRDFISHRQTTLELDPGVIVLIGPNGAGKSSIVDGIAFSILGNAVSRKTKSVKDLIRYGAPCAHVKLSLEFQDNEFIIERKLCKDRGSEAYIYKVVHENGKRKYKTIAKGSKEVNKEVLRLFEVNSKNALEEVIFVPQARLTEIIDMSPREREELVKKVLGLDNLNTIKNNLREAITLFKEKFIFEEERRKSVLESKLSDLQKKKHKLEELRKVIKAKESELNNLRMKLDELKSTYISLSEKRVEYLSLYNALKKADTEIDKARKKLQETDREMKEIEKLLNIDPQDIPSILDSLKNTIRKGDEILDRYNKYMRLRKILKRKNELEKEIQTYNSLKREIEIFEDEKERIEKDLLKLESMIVKAEHLHSDLKKLEKAYKKVMEITRGATLADLELELIDLRRELEELERELDDLEKKHSMLHSSLLEKSEYLKLLKGRSRCPVCGRPLTPEEKARLEAKYREEINKLKNELDSIRLMIGKKRKQKEKLQQQINDIEKEITMVDSILNTLDLKDVEELDTKIKEIKTSISNMGSYDYLHKEKRRLLARKKEIILNIEKTRRKLEVLEKKKGELDSLVKEIEELKSEGINENDKSIIADFESYRKARDEFERLDELYKKYISLKSAHDNYDKELNNWLKEKKTILSKLNQLKFDEEQYRKLEDNIKDLSDKVSSLEKDVSRLKGSMSTLSEETSKISELEQEIRRLQREIDKKRKFVNFIENFYKSLDRKIVTTLLANFREIWSQESTNILSLFETRQSAIEIDSSWGLRIMGSDGVSNANTLSGGERVSLALALRLGLSRVISKYRIGFMILDEPTVYLDAERKSNLKEVLIKSYEGALRQLLIVTHDRELIDVADKVYEVQRDSFSQVEEIKEN